MIVEIFAGNKILARVLPSLKKSDKKYPLKIP
jgi:hypothetical protein